MKAVRLASRALLLAMSLPVLAQAATPIDETRALDPTADVSLDNVKGRILVEVWDRHEIHIGGFLGEGVEGLEIEGDADDLQVRVKYPEGGGWFGLGRKHSDESELRVTLPARVALTVDAVSADVEVRGLAGRSLEIDNVSGDVIVDTTADAVDIDSVSGDVTVKAQSRTVALESVNGDLVLTGSVRERIAVESVSGDIRVGSEAPSQSVRADVVSGDIELRTPLAGGGRLRAESLSGDLEVSLPAGTSARLKASTFSGNLRSDAGSVIKPEVGPGASLDTVLGDGAADIDLETFSGNLTIRVR